MQRRQGYNPKRQIRLPLPGADDQARLEHLAATVRYGGNAEHKRNPGDFGLSPPAAPRRGKSLCDDSGVFRRADAVALLREGLRRGLVDGRWNGQDWPQNIWTVTADGIPLEAQLEVAGIYHGYPMPQADPLRDAVLSRWNGAS